MKKTFTIIIILLISAFVAFIYTQVDDVIIKKTHPLKYLEYVEAYSEKYSVPKDIIYAVIKNESSYQSDAISYKGAIGLMQITPSTYEWLCSKESPALTDVELLYSPKTNIQYGTLLLSILYSEYGVWETAIAAYNAGMGNVSKWLENKEYSTDGRLTYIPFKETRSYVKKVTKSREIYSSLLKEHSK